jgi:hypothetical protein
MSDDYGEESDFEGSGKNEPEQDEGDDDYADEDGHSIQKNEPEQDEGGDDYADEDEHSMLKKGDLVTAAYGGTDDAEWYDGVVTAVHRDGTYDVKYEDGDTDECIDQCYVKIKVQDEETAKYDDQEGDGDDENEEDKKAEADTDDDADDYGDEDDKKDEKGEFAKDEGKDDAYDDSGAKDKIEGKKTLKNEPGITTLEATNAKRGEGKVSWEMEKSKKVPKTHRRKKKNKKSDQKPASSAATNSVPHDNLPQIQQQLGSR